MFPDIHPRFQNSTFNSSNSLGTIYTMCNNMYEGVVFWACFSLVSVLFGLPACVAVLWDLLQRHRRGDPATPHDIYMLNLTVMDWVFLSFGPLIISNHVFWYNWLITEFAEFLFAFTTTGRPLFMSCICLDCYLAVVHPITYRARKGLKSRVLMSTGVWAITLVYGVLYARFRVSDAVHILSVLPFVLTILTIGICDFFILRALKSSDPGGRDLHPQKKKAIQIIVNSLVMTLIAYFPSMVNYSLVGLYWNSSEYMCKVFFPLNCNVVAGSSIMPVLYLSNLGKLDFMNLWYCKAV